MNVNCCFEGFFFSSRRRHTRSKRDWSSDVCSSDLNPRICDESTETDEQYEGCLSFFEVRGMVPRPLAIEVEHQDSDGTTRITTFERGMARLVQHEIDHLSGVLYRKRMRPGVEPIPVSKYRGVGQQW